MKIKLSKKQLKKLNKGKSVKIEHHEGTLTLKSPGGEFPKKDDEEVDA